MPVYQMGVTPAVEASLQSRHHRRARDGTAAGRAAADPHCRPSNELETTAAQDARPPQSAAAVDLSAQSSTARHLLDAAVGPGISAEARNAMMAVLQGVFQVRLWLLLACAWLTHVEHKRRVAGRCPGALPQACHPLRVRWFDSFCIRCLLRVNLQDAGTAASRLGPRSCHLSFGKRV